MADLSDEEWIDHMRTRHTIEHSDAPLEACPETRCILTTHLDAARLRGTLQQERRENDRALKECVELSYKQGQDSVRVQLADAEADREQYRTALLDLLNPAYGLSDYRVRNALGAADAACAARRAPK